MKIKTLVKDFLLSIYYAAVYAKNRIKQKSVHLLTPEESICKIRDRHLSLSRFGDGEFRLIMSFLNNSSDDIGFQQFNADLGKRLLDVLNSSCPELEIGLPSPMFGSPVAKLKEYPQKFWRDMNIAYLNMVCDNIDSKRIYADSFLTRFYSDYEPPRDCADYVKILKSLWDGRNILIVEGEKSRLGVGNDLFDNTLSRKRILCPPKNAFSKIKEIENYTVECAEKDTLVLIALGPTATVLAHDLCLRGVQSIDIGHIDIEYEWMLRGADDKIEVEGKFVNELGYEGGEVSEFDKEYEQEIIGRII